MVNSEKQRTCKDCIYFKACFVNGVCNSAGAMCNGDDHVWEVCGYFSDKSEWVHMPNEDYTNTKQLKEMLQGFPSESRCEYDQ